jgi:hypothetical protein
MKIEWVVIMFVALLLLGCNGKPNDGNVNKTCPSTCQYGCLEDNVTCTPAPTHLCAGVKCNDRCEDESILDSNGECDNKTGICIYMKTICPFGCENNSCRIAPVCPSICPFGCEPGTGVCRGAVCPDYCRYGCIPGTTQCNSEPPSSGIKNGDFEDGYTGWNVSGIAFGSSPAEAAKVNAEGFYQKEPYSGYSGSHFASSYLPTMDKRAMGNITSEPFFISKKYLEFLVIGQLSEQVYVGLLVNNTMVYLLNPDNPYPPFIRILWNVSSYVGKNGVIKVVDMSNRNSVEVDDFRLVDVPSPKAGEAYVEPHWNFSILPPLNWFVVQGAVQGQVFIYGPRENNFTTQIMIVPENLNGNETIGTYFAKGKTGLVMLLQNYSIKSESNVTIGGVDARQIEYTYVSMNLRLESREVFLVHDSVGYKVSGTSAEESFGKYSTQFDDSIKSFKP